MGFDALARRLGRRLTTPARLAAALLALAGVGEGAIMGLLALVDWPEAVETLVDVLLLSLWLMLWLAPMLREQHRRASLATHAANLATEGFWIVDGQGRILDVNDGYCALSGYSRRQLMAMHVADLEAKESPPAAAAHMAQIRTQGVDRFETLHRHADGSDWAVHVTSVWLPEDQAFAVYLRDDRPRLAQLAALREERNRFQALLDTVSAGVWGVDLAGRCTFINAAALRMLGHRDDHALLGQPLGELLGHTEGQGLQLRRADGSRFEAECWERPLLGAGGEPVGQVTSFIDITERRRLQREREQHEETLAAVLSAVHEAIVTIDTGQRVVEFNRAAERLFGYSRQQALGMALSQLLPDAHRGQHQGQADRWMADSSHALRRSQAMRAGGMSARRADGSTFPALIDLAQVAGPQGLLVTAVVRDLSAEHALARALAADRAKSEFLSRVSHELRTPLNAVMGFAELLIDDPAGSPGTRAHAHHVREAGSHLLMLVNDLLDLSAIEAGNLRLQPDRLSLGELFASAGLMVAHQAAQHQVRLHLEDSSLQVQADRARLLQVLVNLMDNAIKYHRRGGEVWLRAWPESGGRVGLEVRDNGPGIPATRLPELFRPFARLGAEAGPVPGTGLGLAIVQGVVEAMQGQVQALPAEGGGLAMRLLLPAAQAGQVSLPPAPAEAQPPAQPRLEVMYAEDDPVNRLLMEAMLARLPGVHLSVAVDGTDALDQLRRRRPDLLLTDMNLGDMNGLDLVQALRQEPGLAALPVAAVSADATAESQAAARAAGFVDYLLKPFEREALEALITRATAGRPPSAG